MSRTYLAQSVLGPVSARHGSCEKCHPVYVYVDDVAECHVPLLGDTEMYFCLPSRATHCPQLQYEIQIKSVPGRNEEYFQLLYVISHLKSMASTFNRRFMD